MAINVERTAGLQVPEPVERYFDLVLPHGWDARSARLSQAGEFLVRPPRFWRPFSATQFIEARPPRFVWDARIRLVPGVNIRVRDAFDRGMGSIHASVFRAFTLAASEGTPELAVGSLQRYLAEAVWCPPALLPDNDVLWDAIDRSSARATITAGDAYAALDFHFADDGRIERVYTASRPRIVGASIVSTPWQGRFASYARRGGFLVPHEGEVEWLLPQGPQPYWRGRVTRIEFGM